MEKAYIDIENSKTKIVKTLELKIINSDGKDFVFDISKLTQEENSCLVDAIDKSLSYTDIELFYVDESNIPYFGTDYEYSIDKEELKAVLKEKMRKYTN